MAAATETKSSSLQLQQLLLIMEQVRAATSADGTVPGKLLRLLFHDCFVEGCDASVLLEGEGTERDDPANGSLGGFQVIDLMKRVLEMCPVIVSCADVLSLVARDVFALIISLSIVLIFTGGPDIEIPTGRRDGRNSSVANVRPNIIDTSFTMDQMNDLFSSKGLSLDDLVVLSGAHTIGSAHCNAFSDRIKTNSKGNLTFVDPSLDHNNAANLTKRCAAEASTSINNDPIASSLFDNQYYKNLMLHKGLFQSDYVLFDDPRTKNLVVLLVNDQSTFFEKWGDSFLKVTSVGVKIGDQGEIRQSCSRNIG
ncbi:hypothetical protein Drorol1_Dr00024890 [Drosera rotundifolia]